VRDDDELRLVTNFFNRSVNRPMFDSSSGASSSSSKQNGDGFTM
jgi:hypothetical protein